MSSKPVVVDKSVLFHIALGNVSLARALVGFLNSERPVFIAQAQYNELVHGSPPPKGEAYRVLLNDLGIKIAPEGDLADRVDLYRENAAHVQKKGGPGPIPEYGGKPELVLRRVKGKVVEVKEKSTPGDLFMAAVVRSLRGGLFTVDKQLIPRVEHLIDIEPESRTIVVKSAKPGQEDVAKARRLLLTGDGKLRTSWFWQTKAGTTVKVGAVIAVGAGGLILRALLGYFAAQVFARYAEQSLNEQFAKIRTRIDDDIRSNRETAVKIAAAGLQPYAVTIIKIWSNSDFVTDQGTSVPVVEYHGLTISPKKTELHSTDRKHYAGSYTDIDIYTTSTPITFDKDLVEMYKDYQKEVASYEQRIKATQLHAERVKLEQELTSMNGEMRKILDQ
jgi:hypothetical protein